MKLKTRLIVAFCVIILLPIGLTGAVLWGFYKIQTHEVRQTYGLEGDTGGFLANSLQLMNRYTQNDYEEIFELSKSDPERLQSEEYLRQANGKLREKSSFLIFCKDGEVVYNGYQGESILDDEQWEQELPPYGDAESYGNVSAGYYIDGETQSLLKQVDFVCSDNSEGSIYIITSSESVLPEIRQTLVEMGIAVVLILALTAGLMTIWLYRGTMTPLKKLQVATKNIKEGNLDFTIDYDEADEMGELCRNFEEMRQRLKESTEEKMAAEQENKALISNIAHDLKTPITAVKGYSEGILDGVADTPEKMERYCRTIYNKANEMDHLINELTLYSQIDTNRIPYNFNKINVSAYFRDCVDEIGLDLETRNIGLSYFNYADEDTVIIADPEQLMRVINNIIHNAVKYMDTRKGQINIRIKDVGDFIPGGDRGQRQGNCRQGICRIFSTGFNRTDASRNSATGGSGIGLSIVKKLLRIMAARSGPPASPIRGRSCIS